MTTILLVVLGLFAGLVGALSGTGGGIILTPMLALYFGLPIQQAIGTSLVAVITTSAASSSVHLQRHTADIRLGMTLELATALGAAVTAYLVGYINRTALEILFSTFLLYGAFTILRKGGKTEDAQDELIPAPSGDGAAFPPYEPKRYPLGMGASLVAGGLSGLLGIGGGPIKVPVMYLFMGVPLIVGQDVIGLLYMDRVGQVEPALAAQKHQEILDLRVLLRDAHECSFTRDASLSYECNSSRRTTAWSIVAFARRSNIVALCPPPR